MCYCSQFKEVTTIHRIQVSTTTGVSWVHDVITCADFYDYRLRGLGMVGGQILAFSTDLRRRPYNTLALPCKCVMYLVVCYGTTVQVCDVPGSMLSHYRASV